MEELVKIKVLNSMIYNLEIVEKNSIVEVTREFARYIVANKQAEYFEEKELNKEIILKNNENIIENKELNQKPITTKKGKK